MSQIFYYWKIIVPNILSLKNNCFARGNRPYSDKMIYSAERTILGRTMHECHIYFTLSTWAGIDLGHCNLRNMFLQRDYGSIKSTLGRIFRSSCPNAAVVCPWNESLQTRDANVCALQRNILCPSQTIYISHLSLCLLFEGSVRDSDVHTREGNSAWWNWDPLYAENVELLWFNCTCSIPSNKIHLISKHLLNLELKWHYLF